MNSESSQTYCFERFRLDPAEREFTDSGRTIQLSPKVFDTLLLLVENAGRVLTKEKMLAEIWADSFVEENNLAQNISQLRKILGPGVIETIPKFGYRFVAEVTASDDEIVRRTSGRVYFEEHSAATDTIVSSPYLHITGSPPALSRNSPETHYVQNGDVNIAYQVIGDGPVDIVFVMGWVSHLEYFWKHHLFASFLDRLASFSRLILFDKRGTGLSDRVPVNELPTLEQRMEDVHAVMDAVDSKRAWLIGVSEGGPMSALFAATYPERTAGLIMIGTYAKRIRDEDYPWAPSPEDRAKFIDIVKTDWGKPVGIAERAPSLAADEEFREWWATYLRMGASPGAAVALTTMNAEIDVRSILPTINVPTLVIHRTGDQTLKIEEGRYVASKIPASKFVELDGSDHLPFVGDSGGILDEIDRFVSQSNQVHEHDRVLATVMNAAFASVTVDESRSVQRRVEEFRGNLIAFDGGELLATFDGPARAIRCALAINENARVGIHTGECDRVGDVYSGFAVELARRIAEKSEVGQTLVSRTVKDLVAGSGITFDEFGIETFANLDGEWRLFTVRQ